MGRSLTEITGASLDAESFFRFGPRGDIWCTTWTADDRAITAGGDPCLLHELRGTPSQPKSMELIGIGDDAKYPTIDYRWYPYGIVEVAGRLHQFVTIRNDNVCVGGVMQGNMLIYSDDGGLNWAFPDGSAVTADDMPPGPPLTAAQAFFGTTPDYPFTQPAFAQYGKGYADNQDRYVYVYAQASLQPPFDRKEELNLARAPVDKILDRSAYEFFKERQSDGSAVWTSDISQKGIVHKFTYAGASDAGTAWHPAVAYIKAIDSYILLTFSNRGKGRSYFADPSRLEILASKTPWGPWTLAHAEDPWILPGDDEARLYHPQVLPQTVAADGCSFWMAFSDGRNEWADPYYSFNMQKVNLQVKDG